MYSIGEFSKIVSLSIKALRLYHEKGILVPRHIDEESGYRYYGAAEIDRARAIGYLKTMTFSLSEIEEMLNDYEDESDLVDFLVIKQAVIDQKIREMQSVHSSLSKIIDREKEVRMMLQNGEFAVEAKNMDGQLVAIHEWHGLYEETGAAFKKLYRAVGRYACGKPFNLYHHSHYAEEGVDIASCVPVRKEVPAEGIRYERMPATGCVALIHKGPYHELGRTYQQLLDHLKGEGREFAYPIREIYLKGPGMILKGNPKNYLTEVQIPLA